jgi:hypothetical protein
MDKRIETDLQDLIKEARASGKWLWCHYQDLWFSPDQLAEQNRNGKFLWARVNWKLRDPAERVAEARARADLAAGEYARIAREAVHPCEH